MSDFYAFASDNPILTLFLVSMLVGAVIRLVPWSKRPSTDDE